jgi:hypothetical protein
MYTYDVQYADFDTYQVKEMGIIDVSGAISAFRSFPFKEEYEKARLLPDGTAPTISFRSQADEVTLAVWLYEPEVYEVFLKLSDAMVTVRTSDEQFIIEVIKSFFTGSREDLFKQLKSNPIAVTRQSLRRRLKSIFSKS